MIKNLLLFSRPNFVRKFSLRFTEEAKNKLDELEVRQDWRLTKIRKVLGYLEVNLHSQNLKIQKCEQIQGSDGEQVYEAMQSSVSNFGIFWYFDDCLDNSIIILDIFIYA
jgi:hypothetical protein